MFQNISEEIEENTNENIENNNKKNNKNWKLIFKNMIKPQNILLYVVALLISTVSIINGQANLAIAIFAATCSGGAIALPVFIVTIIGTAIGFGKDATLLYILNSLVFLILIMLFKPKLQEESRNERRKLGLHLMSAIFLVQAVQIFSASFTIENVLETVFNCIIVYIFYKVFVNSIPVIVNFGSNKAFTAEEAIGASLIIAIAFCSLGNIAILGLSIRNILCSLLILMLAWRNGALIGTTAGVTLGVILSILGFGETTLIAVYAVSGLIVGALNKTGKIGILLALVIGFATVAFLTNISYINYIKETLIAALALLIMPKNISINIKDIIGKTKLLPITKENRLEENKETIYKLNSMTETIDEIARSYEEAAATIVEEDITKRNKEIFIEDMKLHLESISDNMLYDALIETENGIADDIFKKLVENDEIESEDLIKIFENHNNFIIGIEDKEIEREIEKQIYQAVKNINYTYQISKVNFIWKKKVSKNNKIVSDQLNSVSKAINNIAKDMNNDKKHEDNNEDTIFKLSIGMSRTTKNGSNMSGDSNTQLKLKDGKYLLAISDGMGSGTKAKESSKKAIKMLENLLLSGFKKEESISLINSALNTNFDNEMYATLDISVLDLKTGNIELVKSGACPTYIKTSEGVQLVKESSSPAGIESKIELVTYDRDLENGDIIVMCSDGIIDSSGKTNEIWLKKILEEIKTKNVQKIANIIIQEAIDNGLGVAKDDMTIIVAKVEKK